MKYLASNIKNIKNPLHRMQKYILGKVINGDRANDIKDLKDVSQSGMEVHHSPLQIPLGQFTS